MPSSKKVSRTLLVSLLLAAGASCAPTLSSSPYQVKDYHNVPQTWTKVGAAPAGHMIKLQIALKQGNFDQLEKSLFEVSDPSHPKYGQHLSQQQVEDLIKPTDETLEEVEAWLTSHGIARSALSFNSAKDSILVMLPVEKVETLLDTKYSVYKNKADGATLIRTDKYSLPQKMHQYVDTIQPTNSFFRPQGKTSDLKIVEEVDAFTLNAVTQKKTGKTVADVCDTALVTPECLRTLYGTVNYKVAAGDKNQMALNDFLGELNNRSDTSIFLKEFRPEAAAAAYQFKQVSINNGTVQQTPNTPQQLEDRTGIEGALDVQTMLGIAWPTKLTIYSTGGLNPSFKPDLFTPTNSDEPYLAWAEWLLAQKNLPQVISTSYGDDEQTMSKDYAQRACKAFAQLGARGVTVLIASGDEGVGNSGDCVSNDGRNTTVFVPEFPAGCPYVTTVGATHQFAPEVAAFDPRNNFTSGGGFSNYFPRPAYQGSHVTNYLANTIKKEYAGLYNPAGRGYPDIAAQGVNFSVIWNATLKHVDGTSASTPAAAGVLTLVNDALIAAGKPPMGFLNPWLYAGGYKAFNDVLTGSSAGCDTPGFPAAKGWDAVTGLGTPNFPKILEAKGIYGKCG